MFKQRKKSIDSNIEGRKRRKPWKREFTGEIGVPLDQYEEKLLFLTLKEHIHHKIVPPKIKRLYRKLYLRNLKGKQSYLYGNEESDRLLSSHYFLEYGDGKTSLQNRDESLAGISKENPLTPVHCEYTGRVLKPIIWVGNLKTPPWVSFLGELTGKVKEKRPDLDVELYSSSQLQFEYLQLHHIPALNVLANTYFWPFIDLSCALDYKEFSCIAVYKKIIVGFVFMSPGTHLNEGYINFLFVRPHWRNSGIATFMLYHIFNTSMIWDNTLHVSASNPSALLYQKFGFKPHRIYQKFYDKYLSVYSKESRNAVYMKLEA